MRMRAAVMREGKLVVDDVSEPEPSAGEVIVRTLACGICGSDRSMLKHAPRVIEAMRRSGTLGTMDLSRDVVMGHEFCAEIVDHGPDCQRHLKPGTRVCSIPLSLRGGMPATIGYSNELPGGYGQYMAL